MGFGDTLERGLGILLRLAAVRSAIPEEQRGRVSIFRFLKSEYRNPTSSPFRLRVASLFWSSVRIPAKDRGQLEAETIDVEVGRPVARAVEHQVAGDRIVAIMRVARAAEVVGTARPRCRDQPELDALNN